MDITSKDQAEEAIKAIMAANSLRMKEAEAIADKWGVQFDNGGPYGAGADYYPKHSETSQWPVEDDWWSSAYSDVLDNEKGGWISSS